jgi:hypothetical protein
MCWVIVGLLWVAVGFGDWRVWGTLAALMQRSLDEQIINLFKVMDDS